MSDLVTAIIPTYNYANFVARAVTSVLDQSHAPLECIVVDDGSVDNTREVLQAFGERIRVVHQENRGLSAARNTGIREARGRYLAFLDADDWWAPAKIESQVRWLEAHPSVGCVGCGRQHVEADGRVTEFRGQRNERTRTETLRSIAVREFWPGGSGSGVMIRAELLGEAGGFDERLSAAEDWDMWLRLAAITGLDNVPDILTSISRHRTGVFRNVRRMEANQWRVYEKATQAWPHILGWRDRRRMQGIILADAAGESMAMSDHAAARSYLWRALRAWPFSSYRWRTAVGAGIRIFTSREGGRP